MAGKRLTIKYIANYIYRTLAAAVGYVALAKLSLAYFSIQGGISVAWLPGGMALALLLMYGKHFAWSVLLGEFAYILLEGGSAGLALALGGANALAALTGAWLTTRRAQFDTRLGSLQDFVRLIVFAGGVSGLLAAVIDTLTMVAFGNLAKTELLQHLLSWWIGNLVGILLITPLILIWRRPPLGWLEPWRLVEVCALLALAFLVGQVIFLGWFKELFGSLAQSYWLFMVVAIATVRLGRHGVVLMLLMAAIQGLVGALHGVGLFANDVAQSRLANYWLYMVALSGFGMAGATYFSELKRVQSELAQREESRRRQFADNSTVMLLIDPSGRILDANQAALRFYGYARERFLAMQISDVSQRSAVEILETLGSAVQADGAQFESVHRLADGSVRDVSVSSSPIDMDSQRVLHTIVFDITDRKRAEAEIQELAFFDPLTHLPNRRLLLDRLHQAIAASARSQRKGALLFIDLDNFKALNDTHGHEKGDLMLQHAAHRLSGCIRQGDTVARLGGDEFVVMLKDLSSDATEATDQVAAVGAKVLAALKLPYHLGGVEHHSSASIGMALFGMNEAGSLGDGSGDGDGDGDSVEVLFKRADLALYQAKATGRNVSRFFDPAMQLAVTARAALEVDLRKGLQTGQFLLHYQAQVNAEGRLTGAEVLARWRHPTLGMVPPVQFIRLAEDTGLILPLGHWVLETACTQLAEWGGARETQHLTLSVNVSARQFHQPGFVQEVLDVLRASGAPANRLKIELTESLLVDDMDDIIAKMDALKAEGVGFSLDDFGTGYSSLAYLKRLPLDQLKIDQSFVRDALTDPNDAAIAKTIVALGQSLGLTVIAEGVETQAQRDFLWQNGCYAYQGYFFGRPGPVEGLAAFITGPAPLA
jgi:diguanylate cyclase (GGDEF)-like protein/PAS domain S-box-containing protein